MPRIDGSLARTLEFDERNPIAPAPAASGGRGSLRLAPARRLAGPGKYKVLEARRRHAQLNARRLLDLLDAQENGR